VAGSITFRLRRLTHIGAPSKSTKRLTLDLDEDLHRRIKVACSLRGTTIVEEITKLLKKEFTEP
jgi:macrodomain Ter protein organizer (MatP/YcbG family)